MNSYVFLLNDKNEKCGLISHVIEPNVWGSLLCPTQGFIPDGESEYHALVLG